MTQPAPVAFTHMTHLNAIVDGYEGSVEHFRTLYGAKLNREIPGEEVDACLISIGRVIFELFAPHRRAERGQGRLLAKFGDHYLGIEYQVEDLDEARLAVQAHGMRILNDTGGYFITHPADSFGVSFEIYDDDWHREPPPAPFIEPLHSVAYWRDDHPLGCTGLKRYSVAVADLSAATVFFQRAFGATVAYEQPRPAANAHSVGLVVADTVAELIVPVGEGAVQAYIERYGQRIRSTVLSVRDLGQAERYFAQRGVKLRPGDAPEALAIGPEDNHGLLFEFAE